MFTSTCAPHTNVHIAGAHIGFAGAIWTDRPHLQVLAPTLPLFCHASDDDMRMQIARCLGATKKAILALKDYYEFELPHITALRPHLAFPHPSKYHSLDGATTHEFKYLSHLDEDKLVFCGAVDNDKICIKFVRRYSMEAHVRCSSLGFAPTLKGFERIPGGWYIVVMDFIEDEYHNLETSPDKASFESEVRVSVESLHEAGFVHGDIRSANIMVKKDGSPGIMILDFDWAGLAGQVKYPMGVNDIDIRRPNGAQDNEFIMVEHDIEMLNYMF
jgi:hypothetical protein